MSTRRYNQFQSVKSNVNASLRVTGWAAAGVGAAGVGAAGVGAAGVGAAGVGAAGVGAAGVVRRRPGAVEDRASAGRV